MIWRDFKIDKPLPNNRYAIITSFKWGYPFHKIPLVHVANFRRKHFDWEDKDVLYWCELPHRLNPISKSPESNSLVMFGNSLSIIHTGYYEEDVHGKWFRVNQGLFLSEDIVYWAYLPEIPA